MAAQTMGDIPRQLHMLWPTGRRPDPTSLRPHPDYTLRHAADSDLEDFRALMKRVDLGRWDRQSLTLVRSTLLPGGWLLVTHEPSSTLAATGMAQYRPVEGLYPDGYEVGWIAVHPDHSGRHLGRFITAAVTDLLLRHGARLVYLKTEDFRLAR